MHERNQAGDPNDFPLASQIFDTQSKDTMNEVQRVPLGMAAEAVPLVRATTWPFTRFIIDYAVYAVYAVAGLFT